MGCAYSPRAYLVGNGEEVAMALANYSHQQSSKGKERKMQSNQAVQRRGSTAIKLNHGSSHSAMTTIPFSDTHHNVWCTGEKLEKK